MSDPSPSPAGGSGHPFTLTPLLKALKTRDHEGLSKLRHALRTPLNQIIGYSELLMEVIEETGRTEMLPGLQRIHTGGGELLALIN
ncbi:MAG: adenylate cyclase, partial [Verrucomicrobiota bacterium]|nr:adenylate cyclase [Verrucomicrobiota bacterium]